MQRSRAGSSQCVGVTYLELLLTHIASEIQLDPPHWLRIIALITFYSYQDPFAVVNVPKVGNRVSVDSLSIDIFAVFSGANGFAVDVARPGFL